MLLPFLLTDCCFLKTASESSGHKRSSSWGRTYSFTSAVTRGCVTEEENKNVKAGAQAMLQVCGQPARDIKGLTWSQFEHCLLG